MRITHLNDQHIDDDDAQVYALGLLDPARGAAIENHLGVCAACRARVVAAEAAAAALAAALPAMPAQAKPGAWRFARPLATAAVLALAAGAAFEGYVAHDERAQVAQSDRALLAIASSHFAHTTLDASTGVVAKALYSHDGSWCYVVATGVHGNAHVVALQHGTRRDLGALSNGTPATLFVSGAGRVDEVTIVEEGHTVAHGAPAY